MPPDLPNLLLVRHITPCVLVGVALQIAKSGKAKGSESLLKQTLNRLLTAGMADNSVDIRSAVFGALHPSLDPFLASPANVPIIVAATNDESLEVRFQHVFQVLVEGDSAPQSP